MATLTLVQLTCIQTTTGPGDDELYFRVQADGGGVQRYPTQGNHGIGKDGIWDIDQTFTFSKSITATLMEQDSIGGDDTISTLTFKTTGNPASPQPMNGDGGSFSLSFTVD